MLQNELFEDVFSSFLKQQFVRKAWKSFKKKNKKNLQNTERLPWQSYNLGKFPH